MKSSIKFLIFLVYTLTIFIIKSYLFLPIFFIINIVLMFLFKISFNKVFKIMLKMSVLILITLIFNFLITDLETAVIIAIKLLLVLNSTYIFSNIFSYTELARTIEIIAYPFKLLGVNPKDIGLIVSIGIAFIPILSNELQQIKEALVVKGFNIQFINVIKNLNLILKPFFISVLQRVNELESSLKSKAYQE